MRGKIHQIVYELDGIPIGLVGEAQWREAMSRGELARDTVVIVYRESEPAHSQSGGDVPELRPLFDEREAAAGDSADPDEDGAKAAPPPPPPAPLDDDGVWVWNRPYDPDAATEDDSTDEDRPSGGWGRPAALLGSLVIALAALALAVAAAIRSDPGPGGKPRWYRVIMSADIRKGANVNSDPVRTLTRNRILRGIPDEKTQGKWLRIVDGRHAGFFFKMENLELANVSGNEIEIVD